MSSLTDWLNDQAAANRQKAATVSSSIPRTTSTPQKTGGDFWGDTGRNIGNFVSGALKWDVNGYRPVQDLLNKITAGAAGTGNALTKYYTEFNSMSDEQYKDYIQNALKSRDIIQSAGAPGGYPTNMVQPKKKVQPQTSSLQGHFSSPAQNWIKGATASWTGNTDSTDYNLGHDAMEAASQGRLTLNPNMTEGEKFWGGLGIDILGDPLTYLPGGVIAAPVRGAASAAKAAVRGVKAAEGAEKVAAAAKVLPKTVAGAVVGTGAEGAYKAGRFTGMPKPVGLQQWAQVRNFEKFENAARTSGVGTEDLLKLIMLMDLTC
jgi:hypothetical protein